MGGALWTVECRPPLTLCYLLACSLRRPQLTVAPLSCSPPSSAAHLLASDQQREMSCCPKELLSEADGPAGLSEAILFPARGPAGPGCTANAALAGGAGGGSSQRCGV